MKISFTICSANYLPFAKSLADSLIKHNPEHKFIIVLLDNYRELDLSFFDPHRIIHISDMALPDFDEMNERYNIFELSCAMKPYAAAYILQQEAECNKLFYFDSDILVFNSFLAAEEALEESSILLTPHLISKNEFEDRIDNEVNVLRSGIFNAGFFAIKRGKDSDSFLDWWMLKLKSNCYNDLSNGFFVDQIWLNFVTIIFNGIKVMYNEGYNVACWNLGERIVSLKDEKYFINEKYPLVFYHFSGYDIEIENTLSKHFLKTSFEKWPECILLFKQYKYLALENNGKNNFFLLEPKLGKKQEIVQVVVREKNFFKRKYKKWVLKI